jgi:hypothetical protein
MSQSVSLSRAWVCAAAAVAVSTLAAAQQPPPKRVPGQMPDPSKAPPVVTPGPTPGAPPSDAIVLFDGTDLSKWASQKDPKAAAGWVVADGAMEVKPKAGGIQTKDAFGSVQLHLEFATPAVVKGAGQGRGNSGVAFLNGVLVQDHVEVMGVTAHDRPPFYEKHGEKEPLSLQDHGDLVKFRNIWVRPLD